MLRPFQHSMALVAALLLAACGGGGGSGSTESPAQLPATVGVVFTDAPSADVDEALATVTGIELFGDGGRQTIFTGEETFDLLRLRDSYEFFTVADDIRPGRFQKIRLTLSRLRLITRDASGAVINTQDARLPGNGKLDLNPRGGFSIDSGEVVFITLDVDMDKSLKLTTTGGGKINVRPVVFVTVDSRPALAKFTRVSGEIVELFPEAPGFRFCRAGLVADPLGPFAAPPDRALCLDVLVDDATGIFASNGLPADYADLMVGDVVTVAGRLRVRPRADDVSCKGSGDDAEICPLGSGTGENVVVCPVSDADCSDNVYFSRLLLKAFVVEEGGPGTFRRIAGTARSPVDGFDRFDFEVAAGQGFADNPVIAAQIYPKTRIFDRTGAEFGTDSIVADKRALLDAVLKLGSGDDEDELRASLIILGADLLSEEVLLGQLATVEPFVVATPGGDRCVELTTAIDIFLVETTADGLNSKRVNPADLEPGQAISVFGNEGTGGCFQATTIIAATDMP